MNTVTDFVKRVGRQNEEMGWRDNYLKLEAVILEHAPELLPILQNYAAAAMIALIHSEVSEALEGLRKGLNDDHLPHRKMAEAEMADAFIRECDFMDFIKKYMKGYEHTDLEATTVEKMLYNKTRADHKPENRAKEGGKKF